MTISCHGICQVGLQRQQAHLSLRSSVPEDTAGTNQSQSTYLAEPDSPLETDLRGRWAGRWVFQPLFHTNSDLLLLAKAA